MKSRFLNLPECDGTGTWQNLEKLNGKIEHEIRKKLMFYSFKELNNTLFTKT